MTNVVDEDLRTDVLEPERHPDVPPHHSPDDEDVAPAAGIRAQVSRGQRWRYRFDEQMAKGPASIFIALIVVFLGLLVVLGLARAIALAVIDPEVERGTGTLRQIFLTFLELTDPGSMTQDIDSAPIVKVFTIMTGLIGVVLFSSLIAFITTAVDGRLAQLRKGRSVVIEEGHTLILGWNDRVSEILTELIIANESEDHPVVVIMAEQEKEFMDDYLSLHFVSFGNTKVVTRAGKESALINLRTVALDSAKSVIILARCNAGSSAEIKAGSDMAVVKATLAVTSSLPVGNEIPVVVELFGADQRSLAESIDPSRVICMDTDEILAKIIVQTSRSSGLSVVYEEMLSFDGAELYLFEDDWDPGETYGSVSFQLPDGVPIGAIDSSGDVVINPDVTSPVEPGTTLIVLASDDSALRLSQPRLPQPAARQRLDRIQTINPERQLVIGLNSKLPTILDEYAAYVAEGSAIDIVARHRGEGGPSELPALAVENGAAIAITELDIDPFDIEALHTLDLASYANIILLSEEDKQASEEWIDSETLIILLQLQRLLAELPEAIRPKLIAEILGSESRDLVTRTGVKEFVISNRMISMLVAQISENRELEQVYDNLFAEDGSEVYLKDVSLYFDVLPTRVSFADIMAAAQARSEVAIGLKLIALETDSQHNFGVELVPDKAAMFDLNLGDTLVVVAEDET